MVVIGAPTSVDWRMDARVIQSNHNGATGFAWPLGSGDQLLWSGKARKRYLYTRGDALIDFVALLFLVVFVPVTDGKEGTWMNPFFLAFFATGLFLVALRALVCVFLQGYTRYAVTDRRVFVN